ncbi:MAG TPA: BON domain-containing protein [Planctomycetaceae bacterium]|nr:BON domain-containing protein [Planctomycetaceae bacterium]
MRNLRPVNVGSSRAFAEPAGESFLPHSPFLRRCVDAPHGLEEAVHRRLRSQPGLRIASLVIRRIPNGVCLEGVLESDTDQDVCTLARSVAGVDEVLNHLVIRQHAR